MVPRRAPFIVACLTGGFLVLTALLQQPSGALTAASRSGLTTTAVLTPIQSAYVDQGVPDANFGGQESLVLGTWDKALYRRFIYLQFDLSGIPAGADFASAHLRLHQNQASGADPYWVWSWTASSSWSESTLTWKNQPWGAYPSGEPIGLTSAANTWFEWDVGPIVDPWLTGGQPAYGIVLAGDNTTLGEHGFDNLPGVLPQLVIEYTVADTPTPTATDTPTATTTPSPTPTETGVQAFTDLGDAPDSSNTAGKQMEAYPGVWADFPTVYEAGSPPIGPLHRNQPLRFWLGPYVSTEYEADTGYDEDGENNLQPAKGLADRDLGDDGVELPASWDHCKPVQLTYHVTSAISEASSARLNVWADWDGNGAWGDELLCGSTAVPEWAVQNAKVDIPGYGQYTFTTPAFYVYRPDDTKPFWLRVTLSESDAPAGDGSGPAGGWADGETEDYLIAGSVTPTPTATATVPSPSFSLDLKPATVNVDLDPLVTGQTDVVLASTKVVVKLLGMQAEDVVLKMKAPPGWLKYDFMPDHGTPSFEASLELSVSRDNLPAPGSYQVTIVGESATDLHEAALTIIVHRTAFGDLVVDNAEAVQVLEARSVGAPLVRDKATAFKVHVTSTFPGPLSVSFRLSLPSTEWDSPLVVFPPTASGAAAPAGPTLAYPDLWGPYRIVPGDNTLWLPRVESGRENARLDLTTNPAGIIAGQCRGGSYWQCTIDTRRAPRPIAAIVHFTIAADPANAIVETDEGNNSFGQPGYSAVSTRPWRFYFIPVEQNYSWMSRDVAGVGAKNLTEFMVANFPIADTKVSYSVSYGLDHPVAGESRGTYLNRLLTLAHSEHYDYAVGVTSDGCGGGGSLEHVYATGIGGNCPDAGPSVLAHEFLHGTVTGGDTYSLDSLVSWDESYCEYTDSHGALQRQYCAWSNTPPGEGPGRVGRYCTQTDRLVPVVCSGTITKNLLVNCHCSHGYADGNPGYACQETPAQWTSVAQCHDSCVTACDALGGHVWGGPDNRTAHPSGYGMWVNKWVPTSPDLNSFMDTYGHGPFPHAWQMLGPRTDHATGGTLSDGWQNIMNDTDFLRATDPAVLLVSGSVTSGGSATFQPFLRLPEGLVDLEPGSTGAYELRLVGDGGALLSTTGFDLSFEQTDPYGGPVDEAFFSYRIEWVEGTQAIELWSEGAMLAQRIVSANAPKLALLSPVGGRYRSILPVAWSALDDDHDPLTFAISVSTDGGATWNPIALGLTGEVYELSLAGMPPGSSYRLKLRATDGVNTTEVVSAPFTVLTQVELPLVLR